MDEISSSFSWLADAMDFLFSSVRLFHGLTIFVVLISIFTIFRSRDEVTVLLSFAAVGTYLLFSYLNPHVPLRYLIMIILPGLLAGILHLASDDPETR